MANSKEPAPGAGGKVPTGPSTASAGRLPPSQEGRGELRTSRPDRSLGDGHHAGNGRATCRSPSRLAPRPGRHSLLASRAHGPRTSGLAAQGKLVSGAHGGPAPSPVQRLGALDGPPRPGPPTA